MRGSSRRSRPRTRQPRRGRPPRCPSAWSCCARSPRRCAPARDEYAALMTREMGKPITEAAGEVEKSAVTADYYVANAARDPRRRTRRIDHVDGVRAWVGYEPLGVIYAVMPWNFPFWQVMRAAIPTLAAGNAILLKHSPNVTGSALAIQQLVERAGFPHGLAHHPGRRRTGRRPRSASGSSPTTGSPRSPSPAATGPAPPSAPPPAARSRRPSSSSAGPTRSSCSTTPTSHAAATAAVKRPLPQHRAELRVRQALPRRRRRRRRVHPAVRREDPRPARRRPHRPGHPGRPDGPRRSARPAPRPGRNAPSPRAPPCSPAATAVDGPGTYYQPTVLGDTRPGIAAFDEETFGPVAAIATAAPTPSSPSSPTPASTASG